jgi:hypothetical protein
LLSNHELCHAQRCRHTPTAHTQWFKPTCLVPSTSNHTRMCRSNFILI